jgi:hypothetical protein
MLKSTTKKRKVIITKHLYAIAYNPTIALTVFHEVNFHFPMPMHRICMLLLMAFYQMIAILLREACDLGNYFIHLLLFLKLKEYKG